MNQLTPMNTLNGYTLEEVKARLTEAVLRLADVRDHRTGVKHLNLGGNLYTAELRVDECEDACHETVEECRDYLRRYNAGERD
jgi:hypothetical protein